MCIRDRALITAFTAAPYRPTGLAAPDQGLANLVETLEWLTTLVSEATREGTDLTAIDEVDRRLFLEAVNVLRGTASVLSGTEVTLSLGTLEELRLASAARIASLDGDGSGADEVHVSFHAQIVATAARSAAVDALIAGRRVDPSVVATELARWSDGPGAPISSVKGPGPFNTASLNAARRLVTGHASVRSVWFVNSARGAVALAVAVGVADLSNVQHGFWVVLGALSVLRTNAASTGATALRALVGTTFGFFIEMCIRDRLTTLISEATREGTDLTAIDDIDRRLFREAVNVLRGTASLLSGTGVELSLGTLEELRLASAARIASLDGDGSGADEVHVSFHAQIVATAARSVAVDALIAGRRVDPSVIATEVARWLEGPGAPISSVKGSGPFNTASLNAARRLVTGHASLRSVWFVNSARGAVALACLLYTSRCV